MLALWSRAVYQPRRDSGHMLIITSAVVLLGSAVHTCLCAVPWLCAVVAARARARFSVSPAAARATPGSAPRGYSVHSVLLSVFDVARARRWAFSRRQLWLLAHPFALGLFALALALPCYDLGCSVSLCAGLSFRGSLEEFRRGALWKRKTREQMLVGGGIVCGYILNAMLFAMAYVALSHLHANDPYKASTVAEDIFAGNTSMTAYYNGTFVFLDREELNRYLASGTDARMPVRVMLWSLCFCAPALLGLGAAPDADLAQSLDVARPGVAGAAGIVLLAALGQEARPLGDVLNAVNTLGSFYLLFSGFVLAAIAFAVLRLIALRRSLYGCMVVHGACVARVFAYDGLSLASGTVQHLVIGIFVLAVGYLGLCVLLVRSENHAVRLGWGGHFQDDRFVIGTSDDEDGDEHEVHDADAHAGIDLDDMEVGAPQDIAAKYNVEDVISTVEDEMRKTEERMNLLQHGARQEMERGNQRKIDVIAEEGEDEDHPSGGEAEGKDSVDAKT